VVNDVDGLRHARWYTGVARSSRRFREAALSVSRVLADDEHSYGIHLDARHDPELVPMAGEVADIRNRTQVANVRGCAEAEGHPVLQVIHVLRECPYEAVLNGSPPGGRRTSATSSVGAPVATVQT